MIDQNQNILIETNKSMRDGGGYDGSFYIPSEQSMARKSVSSMSRISSIRRERIFRNLCHEQTAVPIRLQQFLKTT